jgi:dTDP-4-amino-4,6-dideoxygalactose transaminase
MTSEADGPWYYQQIDLGYNYRMTDIQAALGCSQMTRLDEYVRQRHAVRQRYDEQLAELPVKTPWQDPDSYSALHLYPIQVMTGDDGPDRRQVFGRMREAGIGVNVHYIPVHTQPYYRKLGFRYDDYPQAVAYYQRAISIPMFSTLTIEQQQEVVNVLRKSLS